MTGHHHEHSDSSSSQRMGLAFFLNAVFTVIEFVGGWLTNSTAIMADAVHDLGDSLAIGFAWLLDRWGNKAPDYDFTYGYRRLSLFGALFNSLILLVGSLWILNEALPRLANPPMPHAQGMLGLAVLGVFVNGFAAYRLGQGKTLNERVLNWHLLEDMLGWVAVLIVAIVLQFRDWPILDPILSIGFTLFILFNVVKNLAVTLKLFFQAVPDKQLLKEIHAAMLSVDHVSALHHLHLWSLDGEHHVLSVHVVTDCTFDLTRYNALKVQLAERLAGFNLAHTTLEIELNDESCRDWPPVGGDHKSHPE